MISDFIEAIFHIYLYKHSFILPPFTRVHHFLNENDIICNLLPWNKSTIFKDEEWEKFLEVLCEKLGYNLIRHITQRNREEPSGGGGV